MIRTPRVRAPDLDRDQGRRADPQISPQSSASMGGDGADAVCHLLALYEGKPGQWDAFWERAIN